jgi:hypothetical protein
VNKVTLLGDGAGASRSALVEFDTAAAASKALHLNDTPLGAQQLQLVVTLEGGPAAHHHPAHGTPVGNKREAHEERTPDGDGADGKRTRRE